VAATEDEKLMLEVMVEGIFGFLVDWFIAIFWWLLLFPVIWLSTLPFILVIALFRPGKYSLVVSGMLYSVHSFWRDWGILFTPF
jgi:hypothetical protein